MYHERRTWFDHTNDYFEYLSGGLGFKSKDVFVMLQMGVHKVPPSVDDLALKSYNRMHASYQVQVE